MLKNQVGSTLMQVLIAMGVVGGASVAFLRSQETSTKIQVKENYNQDLAQIVDQIQGTLARSENCWVTINKTPKDGIYLGNPEETNDYYKNFNTDRILYKKGELIGNSGIMITDVSLATDAGMDYLEVRFKAKEGVKMFGSSDELQRFRIKYSYNIFGAPDSCYSEEGDDVSRTVVQGCLDMEGTYSDEKCNLESVPTCIFSPEPCGGLYKESGTQVFLKEVGTNPGFEPKTSFADANYTSLNMYKCCRQTLPINPD